MLSQFSAQKRMGSSVTSQLFDLDLPNHGGPVDFLVVCDDDAALGRALVRSLPPTARIAWLRLPQRLWDFSDPELATALQERVAQITPDQVLLVAHSDGSTPGRRPQLGTGGKGGLFKRVVQRQQHVSEIQRFAMQQVEALREALDVAAERQSAPTPVTEAAIYRAETGLVVTHGEMVAAASEPVLEGGAQ